MFHIPLNHFKLKSFHRSISFLYIQLICVSAIFQLTFFIIPHSGTAMKIEENTPEINPINNAKVKLNIVGAPKNSIATTTTITVNTVLIERVIVCLMIY